MLSYAGEHAQKMQQPFTRPDSVFAEDGDWSDDEEDKQEKQGDPQQHPRLPFLPGDSDGGECEVDYVEPRLDLHTAGVVAEAIAISNEQQLMAHPQNVDSTTSSKKKFRKLRKALSKMQKACRAAVAAVASFNCFGNPQQA